MGLLSSFAISWFFVASMFFRAARGGNHAIRGEFHLMEFLFWIEMFAPGDRLRGVGEPCILMERRLFPRREGHVLV